MSLNSHWFQNGQLSKLEERKNVHGRNPGASKTDVFFRSSNFDGWPFWNQWEFRDIMYLILKV